MEEAKNKKPEYVKTSSSKQGSNKKILVIIGLVIGGLVLLCCCISLTILILGSRKDEGEPVASPTENIELMIALEEYLGMEEVLVFETEGNILEVKFKSPNNNNQEEVYHAMILVFDYIDQNIINDVESIRLVFTINSIDSGFVEVEREEISKWRDGDISDSKFVGSFRKVKLVE